MKEIDDTPLPENESKADLLGLIAEINHQMVELAKRIARLESRRVLQADPNDDEEWY